MAVEEVEAVEHAVGFEIVDGFQALGDEETELGAHAAGRFPAAGALRAGLDAHTDPRTREFSASYLAPLGISSMLDAPIRVGGRMIGVICNEQVGPARTWSIDEEQFAGSLADFIALAMESSQRRETEQQLRTMLQEYEEALPLAADVIGRP